jgi:hypothetical protein
MVGVAQIKNGLMAYATQHMMPKMDSKGQFLLGMGLGAVTRKAEELLSGLTGNSIIAAAGYVKDGQIDLDVLYSDAASQMKRQGQLVWDVPLLGRLTFTEQDLRDLRQCILNGG